MIREAFEKSATCACTRIETSAPLACAKSGALAIEALVRARSSSLVHITILELYAEVLYAYYLHFLWMPSLNKFYSNSTVELTAI